MSTSQDPSIPTKVAAIVVGYRPDPSTLLRLLSLLSPQVDYLYLLDNGGCESIDTAALGNCQYIKLAQNFGLGYALNMGFKQAIADGTEYVATFDQDSEPPDDLITRLVDEHIHLQAQCIPCAAVSPVFFDRRETHKISFPFYKEESNKITVMFPSADYPPIIETDTLITSGMLIKASVWQDNLAYDDTMFVDFTDTEWCFRARSRGYRLFASTRVKMGHALSDAPPLRLFNLNFFHYSPLRRYYYFRNTILVCKMGYVSVRWKRRLYIGLVVKFIVALFYENQRGAQFKMMCKGLWAGIQNKSGVYPNQ